MSYTNDQLIALKAAVAKGVKSVTYDGQTVVYQSIGDMLKVIGVIERDLASTGNTRRREYGSYDRGT